MAETNPILKKMIYKEYSPVLFFNAPESAKELIDILKSRDVEVGTEINQKFDFQLNFFTEKLDFEANINKLLENLSDKGVMWVAYPKKTSKKYKSDITRDVLRELSESQDDYEGVSLIALDDDWSCMRIKRKA